MVEDVVDDARVEDMIDAVDDAVDVVEDVVDAVDVVEDVVDVGKNCGRCSRR